MNAETTMLRGKINNNSDQIRKLSNVEVGYWVEIRNYFTKTNKLHPLHQIFKFFLTETVVDIYTSKRFFIAFISCPFRLLYE